VIPEPFAFAQASKQVILAVARFADGPYQEGGATERSVLGVLLAPNRMDRYADLMLLVLLLMSLLFMLLRSCGWLGAVWDDPTGEDAF
jgi:hypothetical protein